MIKNWTPQEIAMMMSVGTACLCLIVLVLGAVLGVLTGVISEEHLGTVGGAGMGSGLLGFALISYKIINASLKSTSGSDRESS